MSEVEMVLEKVDTTENLKELYDFSRAFCRYYDVKNLPDFPFSGGDYTIFSFFDDSQLAISLDLTEFVYSNGLHWK